MWKEWLSSGSSRSTSTEEWRRTIRPYTGEDCEWKGGGQGGREEGRRGDGMRTGEKGGEKERGGEKRGGEDR